MKSVAEYPALTNRKAVRIFFSMIGFYGRFICSFAQLAKPLTDLLKGKLKFDCSPECREAFEHLEDVLCLSHSAPT